MISSLAWVPRGAARARPVKYELSAQEYERVKALAAAEEAGREADRASEEGDDDEGEEDGAGEGAVELPAEYDMEHYDSEDEAALGGGRVDPNEGAGESFSVFEQGAAAFAVEDEDDDDEDAEDNEIRPTDAVLVVAMTEDEFSHLEVQVLSEDGNMFVHHDIQLPEFPLCTAWMDCPPYQLGGGQQSVGSYIAVGSFNPAIEIWNLDVLDPLEPSAVLGGEEEQQETPKKGKKGKKSGGGSLKRQGPVLKAGSHREAVMSLSWNKVYRQALASGSADTTVKIWDVTTQACSHTFTHHSDKVQSVLFHPDEAWRLATGSYDKTVALLDCRSGATSASYKVPADMESLAWDPFQPNHLYAALENGVVVCIDVRNADQPLYNFQAHPGAVSSLGFSASVPGFMCTASEDKTIKVWDVASCQSGSSQSPEAVAYKTMNVGKLFALQFFPDNPFLLATGGDAGMVAVWESDEMAEIQARFATRVQARESPYASLALGGEGAAGALLVAGSGAGAGRPVEDDSWMDEPAAGAGGGGGGGSSDAKKKNKGKGKGKDKKVAKSSS